MNYFLPGSRLASQQLTVELSAQDNAAPNTFAA